MHKPHEYPLRVRFWHFVRGLLFYNTVYWKRASDELKPPRLSREERNHLQPAPDPDIVRPRERPRANPLPDAPSIASAVPPFAAQPPPAAIPTPVTRTERRSVVHPPTELLAESAADSEPGGEEIIVKRRRYRRRKKNVRASRSPAVLAANAKQGFLARWFGRSEER